MLSKSIILINSISVMTRNSKFLKEILEDIWELSNFNSFSSIGQKLHMGKVLMIYLSLSINDRFQQKAVV